MAVGDFAIVKDSYNKIPVDYYVEKKFVPVGKKIFGLTPQMMSFFSQITGVPYPWNKYAQVALRNFTSTAMENTSVSAHSDAAMQDARELVDQNRWENNIAHELFHQWFGDLVTCESWSNLVLNEGFADYGTCLWKDYYYGKDAAEEYMYNERLTYLNNKGEHGKDLVRFHYNDPEDMFDDVSYQKASYIIHMLRHITGDSAFFKALHLYLTDNKFRSAEVQQLRLILEEITGKDLNWFFNQWFYGSGHPKVEIQYSYDEHAKKAIVTIEQKQPGNIFRFPMVIDVYDGRNKVTHPVWVYHAKHSFAFPCAEKPVLINADGEKYMLWEKVENKTMENYLFQYTVATNYTDRLEAVNASLSQNDNPVARYLLQKAMTDHNSSIKILVLKWLNKDWDKIAPAEKNKFEPLLYRIVKNEESAVVRASAIELLGYFKNSDYHSLFLTGIRDSSYSVAGAALIAMTGIDSSTAFAEAKKQMNSVTKRSLTTALLTTIMDYGSASEYDFIYRTYQPMPDNGYKIKVTPSFIRYIKKIESTEKVKASVDLIIKTRNSFPDPVKASINETLQNLARQKESGKLDEQAPVYKKFSSVNRNFWQDRKRQYNKKFLLLVRSILLKRFKKTETKLLYSFEYFVTGISISIKLLM